MLAVRRFRPSSGMFLNISVVTQAIPGALLFLSFLTTDLTSSIIVAVSRGSGGESWGNLVN